MKISNFCEAEVWTFKSFSILWLNISVMSHRLVATSLFIVLASFFGLGEAKCKFRESRTGVSQKIEKKTISNIYNYINIESILISF